MNLHAAYETDVFKNEHGEYTLTVKYRKALRGEQWFEKLRKEILAIMQASDLPEITIHTDGKLSDLRVIRHKKPTKE